MKMTLINHKSLRGVSVEWCSGQGVGPERWQERGQPERGFESHSGLLLNGRHCTTQSGPLSCNPVAWAHHVVIKNYFGSNTRRGMCLPVDFPLSSRRSKQIMLRRSKCSMGRAIKWCRFVGTYPVRYTEYYYFVVLFDLISEINWNLLISSEFRLFHLSSKFRFQQKYT